MARSIKTDYLTKVQKPEDFDQFWDQILTESANIQLNPSIHPDPLRSSNDIEVFQVFYDSLDHVRIAGWYCLPSKRSKKLPAIILLPGYQSDPQIPKEWAKLGYAALSVAPRGKLRSNRQFNPGYPGLLTYGLIDRNVYSYRGFYVDAWRSVDYLIGREEVDRSRIGVTGSSQGGGLTITTAAMRKEIKVAAAGAPYLCGFIDSIELTDTYPYQEINDYIANNPDKFDLIKKNLAYFDGINFADKINCPIIVNIGLQDNVCPPETGFALFHSIGSTRKNLYPYAGHGHDAGRHKHNNIIIDFFNKELKP